jgi:GTP cyclohydrolase II
MPDALHWMGVQRIDNLISMPNMKHDAIVASGIEVTSRHEIPVELIPADASVEMEAKKAAGYFADKTDVMTQDELERVKGRSLHE